MTDIIRKIRGKRKTSSELDSRWGDVSISYPNEGSWSQWDQPPPGFITNTGLTGLRSPSEQRQRHGSLDSFDQRSPSFRGSPKPSPSSVNDRATSADSASTIPTGHYDANVRGRSRSTRAHRSQKQPSGPGLGIGILRNGCSVWEDASSSDDAFSDDDARDISTSTTTTTTTGNRRSSNSGRYLTVKTDETDYSRASKSPPLSVTSRMRPYSYEPSTSTSIPGTASSRHTSFTPCTLSAPPEESRQGYSHSHHHDHEEKKQVRRPKPLDLEPTREQELVPGYDELYG